MFLFFYSISIHSTPHIYMIFHIPSYLEIWTVTCLHVKKNYHFFNISLKCSLWLYGDTYVRLSVFKGS